MIRNIIFIAAVLIFISLFSFPHIRVFICENFSCLPFNYFDALSSLFSGFAFVGLIYTIFQQQDEIRLTQNEMRAQRFEHSFFQLLGHYTHAKEKKYYCEAYEGFKSKCNKNRQVNQQAEEMYQSEFISANNRYESFSSYFVILRELIDYVDRAGSIDSAQKFFYIDIICASLSDYEMWLLFYSTLYDPRLSVLKKSIEKYSMFKNLKINGLISPQYDKVKYLNIAYSLTK